MSTNSPKPHRRLPAGFLGAWEHLVGPRGVPSVAPRRGRKPRVPVTQLLPALTWHVMQDTGTLAEHLFQLFRELLADSSWSDRRQRLPWEIFADLMRRALRPRASPRQHREAFWRGWRLIGPDARGHHVRLLPVQGTARLLCVAELPHSRHGHLSRS